MIMAFCGDYGYGAGAYGAGCGDYGAAYGAGCGDYGAAYGACAPAVGCAPAVACAPPVVAAPPVLPAAAHHTTVEAWGRPVYKKKWLFGKWKYAGMSDVKYVPRTHTDVVPTAAPVAPVSVCAPAPVEACYGGYGAAAPVEACYGGYGGGYGAAAGCYGGGVY